MERRAWLKAVVGGGVSVLAGGLAALLATFAVRTPVDERREEWRRVARLDELGDDPLPVTLSVPIVHGWHRTRAARTVYVQRDGDGVRALSAVCTHLGCLVGWNAASRTFECPCHGGSYDSRGAVVAGPPPRALDVLPARVDNPEDGDVLIRL